ncbi:uncharacterized protein LOC118439467 [Folsomia candida]|uniref:uncharacterized protein LOC118439467 n=1 Tax=Folsomia candida TaxID=158441 RepID=UPI001605280D|nr:uncharacterized protein LOC118439467 [Folsomia candida]
MAGNEMNMYFLVFVAVTTLSGHISGRYISKPGSMNVRFEIHNAPKTDTLSKPDLYVSVQITAYVTYEMSSGCTRTTSHVQDSYHPVFPEVYTYNYGGPYETLFFIVYEKEPFLMADKV